MCDQINIFHKKTSIRSLYNTISMQSIILQTKIRPLLLDNVLAVWPDAEI